MLQKVQQKPTITDILTVTNIYYKKLTHATMTKDLQTTEALTKKQIIIK